MLNPILFALYQSCTTIIISADYNQQNTPSLASPGRFGPSIPGYSRKVKHFHKHYIVLLLIDSTK